MESHDRDLLATIAAFCGGDEPAPAAVDKAEAILAEIDRREAAKLASTQRQPIPDNRPIH
jgi:hypothetical protein